MRGCSVKGCDRPHKGHGYCETHLARFRKYGDATVVHKGGRKPNPPGYERPACSVKGCTKPQVGQGLCRNHYMRQYRRGGDPAEGLPRGNFSTPVSTRTHMHRKLKSGCWKWLGYQNEKGYGVVGLEGRQPLAHRAMYEELVGPIPDGLELDHLCANTWCVNPDHLEPVTAKENIYRGGRRHFDLRGHG